MAQQGPLTDLDKLSYFTCSELLKDSSGPVDLCGHTFCVSCTRKHRDQETKEENAYRCQKKNKTLACSMEQQKMTQAASDQGNTGLQVVACDFCTVQKRRASKSCMQCLVSYCEEHLQSHHGVPAQKRHKLMEPIENLQENICSQHNEVKRLFCLKCQECICYLCKHEEHTGHDSVPADTEVRQRQKELQVKQQTAQQTVQVLRKNIELLQQELQAINKSADKVVHENENKLLKLFTQKSMNLTERIKRQQKIEVTRVQGLLKKLQQELDVERERNTELEQVAHIKNHTEFIKKCSSVSAKWRNHESSSIPATQGMPLKYFDKVSKAVSDLNHTCTKGFKNLAQTVTEVDVLLPQNPQSNEEFLQYSFQLTLNQNTASKVLSLSEKNTKVTSVKDGQFPLPDPERFTDKAQVLSMNALPPRCYWEVEWTGHSVSVGVAYKDIKRDGPESVFGKTDKSWMLGCSNNKGYFYRHNGTHTFLSPCESSRVGVFLDHKAGVLCFYEVSETNKLIHKVETTFSLPLYAGLGLYFFSVTAKMCVKEVKGN